MHCNQITCLTYLVYFEPLFFLWTAKETKVGCKGAESFMKLTPARVWKSQLLLALFLIKTMLLFYWTVPCLATWYLLIQQMFVFKHKKQLRQCWLNKQWLHCRKLQFLIVTYFRPTLFTALIFFVIGLMHGWIPIKNNLGNFF